jgi:hypothetical protein
MPEVPEIADCEVRPELLRAGRAQVSVQLDQMTATAGYLPLTPPSMLQPAEVWAQARQQGRPIAPDLEVDADMILSAQAILLAQQGNSVVIATTNVGHFSRFALAQCWQDVQLPTP